MIMSHNRETNWSELMYFLLCHDTEHNNTQCNDTEHNDTQLNDTQYNDTEHNGSGCHYRMLCVIIVCHYAKCLIF
jgi:hypothetical protein